MKCKTCGATPESAEFYASIGTYCKEHWRGRVKANREARVEQYRAYERDRSNAAHRVAARAAYQQTEQGRKAHQRAGQAYAGRNPARHAAHVALGNAVRDGRVTPWPACAYETCEETKVEAHHPDYSRPLDVVWMCPAHHKQAHAMFSRLMSASAEVRHGQV